MEQTSLVKNPFIFPAGETFYRYLRLPYKLLTDTLNKKTAELTELEAFIQLIANVRFAETEDSVGNKARVCQRGESYKSLQAWSLLLHWQKTKTRRYFLKLKSNGIIEMDHDTRTTRIKIIHYDYYVGHNISPLTDSYSPVFESFWKSYHDITRKAATDKIAAYKLWSKLSAFEREKAKEKIAGNFYNSGNTTYCPKALTYLKNKKFNDEFKY